MTWPQPTRADHDAFCRTEGWSLVRDARGGTVKHHRTYELALPDGRILRTRISRPVDKSGYGPAIWQHILRDQLAVDEGTFWACVKDGAKPRRGPVHVAPAESIPAGVVFQLIHKAGVPEAEVARLSRDEAIARLQEFWAGS